MKQLVFFLEEPSARELLKGLVPRIVPGPVETHYLVFEGKQDLEKQLARRLRGWLRPNSVFVVLRDQDAGDCHIVKRRLTDRVAESGKDPVLVRVACRELEAWALGDLVAVAEAYARPSIASLVRKQKFREPDALVRPIEELRLLEPSYQKIDGARRLGPLLDPARSTSPSFRAFCEGLTRHVSAA